MYDKMATRMAQATRLTRAGKLVEATAVIQQTLKEGLLAQEASLDIADPPRNESIDVTAHVIDAASKSATVPSHEKRRSAKLNNSRLDASKDWRTGVSTTIEDTPKSERAEATTSLPKRHKPLSATGLFPGSGRRRSVSIPNFNRHHSEVWAGGQFIDDSYTNQAGTRSYKLYIPSGYHGQALPLVVMLHGCTQTPDDFAAGSRMNVFAEKELFFVVYPTQATSANSSKCWNWFKATDQHRGQGEPSLIAGITHQIISNYHVDTRRVYAAGLSAGGAMAAILGVCYPDIYAAIGIHSGLSYGAAHDLPSAFTAMQQGKANLAQQKDKSFFAVDIGARTVPIIVFHGDRDTTVHQRNGDQVIAQWAKLNTGGGTDIVGGTNLRVSVTKNQVPNGHAYTRSIYHDTGGYVVMEQWLIHGAGHAWAGGSLNGSFTDPNGPDASQEMVRFFCEHS